MLSSQCGAGSKDGEAGYLCCDFQGLRFFYLFRQREKGWSTERMILDSDVPDGEGTCMWELSALMGRLPDMEW